MIVYEGISHIYRTFDATINRFEGDTEIERNWLVWFIRGLDGKTPPNMCKSEAGAREMKDLIHRIENGLFLDDTRNK